MKTYLKYKFLLLFIHSCSALQSEYQLCVNSADCAAGLTCYETKAPTKACLKQCEFGVGWNCENKLKADYNPLSEPFECKFRFGRFYTSPFIDYTNIDYFRLPAPHSSVLEPKFDKYFDGKALQASVNLNKLAVFYTSFIESSAKYLKNQKGPSSFYDQNGAIFVIDNRSYILAKYTEYAGNVSEYLGSNADTVWFIEKDFWRYYGQSSQRFTGPLKAHYMKELFEDIVLRIRAKLPKAKISWEIRSSLNESDVATWWNVFRDLPNDFINYIHTIDNKSAANSKFIKNNSNFVGWQFMTSLTNRKIIADTGMNGHDDAFDVSSNLINSIENGLIGVTQNNANDTWSATIGNIRLNFPKLCPQ